MSNILIIKHGSLGDIVQISGVLKDIRESHVNEKIFILTTNPYVELLGQCPYVDGVLLDKRLPRWNFFYLGKLKKMIEKTKHFQLIDKQIDKQNTLQTSLISRIPTPCIRRHSSTFQSFRIFEQTEFKPNKCAS